MSRRHPTRARLAEWLDGAAPELDDHVHYCARCAEGLDGLDEPGSPLGEALETVLRPPDDLSVSLRGGIARRKLERADVELLTDLLALPLHTFRAFGEDRSDG